MKSFIVLLAVLALSSAMMKAPLEKAKHYKITKDLKIIEIDPLLAEETLKDPEVVSVASYLDDLQTNGWIYMTVNTSNQYPDEFQALAAGYFEGYQAYEYIYYTYVNEGPHMRSDPVNEQTLQWIAEQRAWYNQQIELNPTVPFWQLANLTVTQHLGIYNGFLDAVIANNADDMYLTFDEFYLISYIWDLLDVEVLFKNNSEALKGDKMHCSFLLKLVEDDLYVSHTTWSWFEAMIKIWKTYNFGFNNKYVANKMMSYSSQPGCLESGDDFYILDNNRFVGETTLGSSNPASWDFLHTDSVPYWIRVQIANMAWTTQEEWAEYYLSYRAGTYNNQWIVIDFNEYRKYQKDLNAASNIIWFIEEFYGMTSSQDLTSVLVKNGYVASYNEIWNDVIQQYSMNSDNYTNAPRYFLFEHYAPNISNFQGFQSVMRMNNFSDMHNYSYAIASRFDLIPRADGAFPFGAIDAKATANSLISNMTAALISGPTTELTPPFNWTAWPTYSKCNLGQPTAFNFTWQQVTPFANNNSSLFVEL